jgi:hypothetical protein
MKRLTSMAGALALLVACGPATTVDTDSGTAPQLQPLQADQPEPDEFVPVALDYSCRTTRERPTGGAPVSTRFELRDFREKFEVSGTDVWVFTDNEIGNECTAPSCQSFTSDTMGNGTVTLPADGWFAYRVLPKSGLSRMTTVFAVFQYNMAAPSTEGRAVQGNSVSGSTIDLIPALLGISRTDGLAIVSGRIRDCAGNYVQNAIIRVFDPDGNEIEQGELNDEPHFHFFNGDAMNNLPDQTQTQSNADGLFVLVQIPVVDDRPYRVEAWGNLDGELTQLGCESARIFSDSVTIVNMDPVRADGPSGCAQ